MTNPNRVSARTAVLVAAVILGAVLARILGIYNIYPKTMGIFRSLLYMGLFIVWGFSARQRIIGALVLLIILYKKRRVADKRKLILFPCIPISALLFYLAFYALEAPWLRRALGDMTAFFCLMYTASLEMFIQCGFLQANTHYVELFHASSVAAQITDEQYHVLISSDAAQTIDTSILKQTEKAPVLLENGIRLSCAPIKAGHVVWMEDVSELLRIVAELEDVKEELEETNRHSYDHAGSKDSFCFHICKGKNTGGRNQL